MLAFHSHCGMWGCKHVRCETYHLVTYIDPLSPVSREETKVIIAYSHTNYLLDIRIQIHCVVRHSRQHPLCMTLHLDYCRTRVVTNGRSNGILLVGVILHYVLYVLHNTRMSPSFVPTVLSNWPSQPKTPFHFHGKKEWYNAIFLGANNVTERHEALCSYSRMFEVTWCHSSAYCAHRGGGYLFAKQVSHGKVSLQGPPAYVALDTKYNDMYM